MSVYKPLLSSDIVVSSFEVNKYFLFTGEEIVPLNPYGIATYGSGIYGLQRIDSGSEETLDEVYIDRFLAVDTPASPYFDLETEPTTGYYKSFYQKLVYKTIKQLYYSNFTTSSWGDDLITSSILPGATSDGDVLVGPASSQGRFYNFPQNTLTSSRYFPTSSDVSEVGVLSIPSKLYGNHIQPTTFYLKFNSGSSSTNNATSSQVYYTIEDDGEGNLLTGGQHCGNIIYDQGLAILVSSSADENMWLRDFVSASNISCSFSSSFDIIETQYKCTINSNEFNYSMNPSLLETSIKGQNNILETGKSTYVYYVTGSDFAPYVTTIGLYNENQELLAVGKLSQPLPTSKTTDTTIVINLDR